MTHQLEPNSHAQISSSRTATSEYKDALIRLHTAQEADGTWRCRGIYIEFSLIESLSIMDYPDGFFPNTQEAEAAALHKAKRLIDSEDHLRSSRSVYHQEMANDLR